MDFLYSLKTNNSKVYKELRNDKVIWERECCSTIQDLIFKEGILEESSISFYSHKVQS